MPRKRTRPYVPGDTYYATLAKDGSDAEIAKILNRDPSQASAIVREAMTLYAQVQRGEIPPQLVKQWQRWARAELASQVADTVIAELQTRNLVASDRLTPSVQAEVNTAVQDRFAQTAESEEL